jgi:hypothetical protein
MMSAVNPLTDLAPCIHPFLQASAPAAAAAAAAVGAAAALVAAAITLDPTRCPLVPAVEASVADTECSLHDVLSVCPLLCVSLLRIYTLCPDCHVSPINAVVHIWRFLHFVRPLTRVMCTGLLPWPSAKNESRPVISVGSGGWGWENGAVDRADGVR